MTQPKLARAAVPRKRATALAIALLFSAAMDLFVGVSMLADETMLYAPPRTARVDTLQAFCGAAAVYNGVVALVGAVLVWRSATPNANMAAGAAFGFLAALYHLLRVGVLVHTLLYRPDAAPGGSRESALGGVLAHAICVMWLSLCAVSSAVNSLLEDQPSVRRKGKHDEKRKTE